MNDSTSENRIFRHAVFFHRLSGVWPEDDRFLGKFNRVKGYGIAAVTLGICCYQMTTGLMDNIDASEYAPEITASIIASLKVLPFIFNRENILELLAMTNKISSIPKEDETDKRIDIYWGNIRNRLIKYFIRAYSIILALYLTAPLLRYKGLPFFGVLPKFCYITPWYQIIYIFETILFLMRFAGALSSDIFSITFMCQLCCELEVVKYLITIVEKNSNKQLSRIIARHVLALDYGGRICNSLSTIFLFQHILVAIFLSFAAITTLKSPNLLIFIKMMVMAVIAIITMLIICFVGETVTNASLSIADAIENILYKAFSNNVYLLRLILFILFRAQKPLQLSVANCGKLNLNFFCLTMNKVVSLFMLLKTMM